LSFTNFGFAQVKKFYISPFAEYTWWDDQSGLKTERYWEVSWAWFWRICRMSDLLTVIDLRTNFDQFGIDGFLIVHLTDGILN
jgi:hypothetical protein